MTRQVRLRDEIIRLPAGIVADEYSHLRPLVPGEERAVWAFRLHDRDVVLRVGETVAAFNKETMIERQFASARLPIPHTVEVGNHPAYGAWYLTDFVAGFTLQQASPSTARALAVPIAHVVDVIHEHAPIADVGYVPFDADGRGAFATWSAFLFVSVDDDVPNLPPRERDLARRCRALLQQLVPSCGERRHLVHGDFGSNNLITDGQVVAAVLDWEAALWGDPLYDIANLVFWSTWQPCMHIQADRQLHQLSMKPDPNQAERLFACQLHIGVREAAELADARDPYRTWLVQRLKHLADRALP